MEGPSAGSAASSRTRNAPANGSSDAAASHKQDASLTSMVRMEPHHRPAPRLSPRLLQSSAEASTHHRPPPPLRLPENGSIPSPINVMPLNWRPKPPREHRPAPRLVAKQILWKQHEPRHRPAPELPRPEVTMVTPDITTELGKRAAAVRDMHGVRGAAVQSDKQRRASLSGYHATVLVEMNCRPGFTVKHDTHTVCTHRLANISQPPVNFADCARGVRAVRLHPAKLTEHGPSLTIVVSLFVAVSAVLPVDPRRDRRLHSLGGRRRARLDTCDRRAHARHLVVPSSLGHSQGALPP